MRDFLVLAPPALPDRFAAAIGEIRPVLRMRGDGTDDALIAENADRIACLVWMPFGGPLKAAMMDRLPKLELVASMGAGYEHIDVAHAARRGICVANTPHAVTEDTADAAFALIIDTVRRFPAAERYLRAGKWRPGKPFPPSASLRGKTLGILGYGRIGKAIARRAEAFGLKVAYSGRRKQDGVLYPYFATAEELAANCDILVSVLPGGEATRNAVGARAFAALGPDGFFVNIGRGSSVDEPALISALHERKIAGAGLDVFAHEPDVPAELIAMENVVLLPHVGGATHHVMQAVGDAVVANIRAYAEGKGPLDPIAETPWRG
ncbi:MAG: 2-hydroxyacid dehydrogenase [Hyphomicrobiales bacterium]|nr:2-hydroxyacid dehydrogenase [Hyphomicrobiales bacterium]